MCKTYLFYFILYLFFGILYIYINNKHPLVQIRTLKTEY